MSYEVSDVNTLKPGAVFLTDAGSAYLYLGVYNGKPDTIYSVPSHGHLYMLIGHYFSQDDAGILAPDNLTSSFRHRISGGFDGNFIYSQRPKAFRSLLAYLNIQEFMPFYRTVLGMVRCEE